MDCISIHNFKCIRVQHRSGQQPIVGRQREDWEGDIELLSKHAKSKSEGRERGRNTVKKCGEASHEDKPRDAAGSTAGVRC
jgi:hypothetical protein